MKKIIGMIICFLLLVSNVSADHLENYFRLKESTVSIQIFTNTGIYACSGIIIAEDEESTGILTAKHCIDKEVNQIQIDWQYNVSSYIKAYDLDVAYLEISTSLLRFHPISLAGYNPNYKDIVYTLGYPKGEFFTAGLVAWNTKNNIYLLMKSIPGCSGSGVINEDGELVGILWGGNKMFGEDITAVVPIEKIRPFLIRNKLWNKIK